MKYATSSLLTAVALLSISMGAQAETYYLNDAKVDLNRTSPTFGTINGFVPGVTLADNATQNINSPYYTDPYTDSETIGLLAHQSGGFSVLPKERIIAIGQDQYVTKSNNETLHDLTLVGTEMHVQGDTSTIIGNRVASEGSNVIAIGNDITGVSNNAVVIGHKASSATAVSTPSMTISGTTYQTAGANPVRTVSFGNKGDEAQIKNVAAGEVSATSTDAINGSQLYAMQQAIESMPTSNLSDLYRRMDGMNKEISRVGAMSSAMAALHPLDFDPDHKFTVAAGFGNYKGEAAGAIGAFYRPNDSLMFSVGTSLTDGDNMFNAGISYKFGTNTTKKANDDKLKSLEDEVKRLSGIVVHLMNKPDRGSIHVLNGKRAAFPDVPSDHWANDAVEILHGNNVLEGYPDGEFKGDRPMTRYEYAQMLYKTANKISN